MERRRPAQPPHESRVERQIREAQARGVFDDLPGAGRPLRDLDKPWDAERWAYDWARREGADLEAALPLPLQLRRERERMLAGLDEVAREADVRERLEHFNTSVKDAYRRPIVSGPPMTVGLLDVEQVVDGWRARRAQRQQARAEADGRERAEQARLAVLAARQRAEQRAAARPAAVVARWWAGARVRFGRAAGPRRGGGCDRGRG